MSKNTEPNSNPPPAAPSIRRLFWPDLPNCAVLISRPTLSADLATVIAGDREQVRLLLFRDSLRGLVDVAIERGTVPSDTALIAMGRTIMAHCAGMPEWRDAP